MRFLLIFYFTFYSFVVYSQNNKQSAFTFTYNHQFPKGELAKYFGSNSAVGCSFFQEKENNFFYGIQGSYMFSNNIKKTNLFDNITTSTGAIIAGDGTYANIILQQRGFDAYVFLGYAYHLKEPNLTGIYLSAGIGFLQHQILIDTKSQYIPQLNSEMKKGYDRLHNGLSGKWEISYKYYSSNGKFQAYTGLNMITAYTKSIRPYLFDSMQYVDEKGSWDILVGAHAGVIIPIQRKNEEKFHYY
tara:strand:- start:2427 stop:3158 length:732 start_codon:yes stop_codon:yes gene_type:complete